MNSRRGGLFAMAVGVLAVLSSCVLLAVNSLSDLPLSVSVLAFDSLGLPLGLALFWLGYRSWKRHVGPAVSTTPE